jgi:hypothetical protein
VEVRVTRSPALVTLAPPEPRRLDPALGALVQEGFELVADHVILARHAPTAPPWRRSTFGASAAYYEGSVNHVHVARELVSWRSRGKPGGHAIAFAQALGQALAEAYPARAFDVWAILGDDCIVRFHERRTGEDGWGTVLDEAVPWLGVHIGR